MAHRPLSHKITIGAIIFCGLIFLGYYTGVARFTSSFLISFLNPLIRGGNVVATSLGDFLSLYYKQGAIVRENDLLKSELITLAQKNATLLAVKNENELLKKELQFIDEYQYHYLIARVIGRSFDYEKNYFLIDKGSRDGLSPGLAVTVNQGFIIGTVIKVEDNLSQVRLLTDSSSQIAVTIMGEGSASGLARGEHNINLRIEMLPKNSKITSGNLVVTSNLNLNIPPGLVLGKVQKVEFSDNNLWQSAIAEPLVDYSNIPLVTVILPGISK